MQKPFETHPGRCLCWKHQYGVCQVFARTPEEELSAYLMLFKGMDNESYYWNVGDDPVKCEWHNQAKQGDGQAAMNLLTARSWAGHEYEHVEVQYIDTPPAKQPELGTGDPNDIPLHIIELATNYGDSPEHTQALLDGYRRGDTISVKARPHYKRPSA